MRIPTGTVDQYVYFVAVDATDLKTRETGLSSFTVYRSRNGGAAAAMTTPTVNETDATNMPGVYELLLDEDMTIDAGDDSQEMAFHITQASMAPVTRAIELYRPKIAVGNTLDDARAEPGQGAPSVNADALTKLDYLYKWVRNKKDNDGSTTQLYDDAGTTVDHKQTTSESGGTVTKGEIITGP